MKFRNSISALGIGLLSVVFIVSGLTITTSATSGQIGVANGFKISPVRYEETVDKGATKTFIIYVSGVDDYPIIAQAVVNDFQASTDEGGDPSLLLDTNQAVPADSFKAITSPIPNTEIQPGETAQIQVVIKVPANAQPGGYYGMVRFASALSLTPSTAPTSVGLSASTGTLFLITVPGNLTEKLSIVSFSAAKGGSMGRIYTSGNNLQIITRVQNTGNIHVAPFGKIQVSHSGKVISELKFNNIVPPGQVLPNSIRKFTYSLPNQSLFGKYTVNAYLGYGTQGSLLTAKNIFWVIPWWFIGLMIVIVLVLISAGYVVYRRIQKIRQHRKHIRKV
ncbi:MAG TPA: hypothetical protein VMR51_00070 [Patescibacteria group bacterium]|nr:hypothetical protein [Patescibacteria group bacterium]